MADDNNAQDMDMELDGNNELDEDLTSYGVFVKAGPEDIQEDQSFDQLADFQNDNELNIDIDLEDEAFQIESDAGSGIDKSVFDLNLPGEDEDIISIDDLPDSDYAEDFSGLKSRDESFDDVAAFTESLNNDDSMVEQAIVASEKTATSGSLLATIENELNAIKSELTDLRQELYRLRNTPSQVDAPPPTSDLEADSAETTGKKGDGGFFSADDEDETIVLTGDELDNILNSAEFTEKMGECNYNPEDDMHFESGDSIDSPQLPADTAPEDPFKSSGEEIKIIADLDIDEELSEIDDLKDEEETQLYTGDDLEEMELEIPESSQGDVINEETKAETQSAETEIIDEDPADTDATSSDKPDISQDENLTGELKQELKAVLSYMDSLLENLPEEKIEEFAQSEHFTTYQKLFEELGL